MPPLASEAPEVEEHYITQAAITLALLQAMRELWPRVPTLDLMEQYREVIAFLIPDFQQASIASAFDHYVDMRAAAGVTDSHRPMVIAEWSPARVDAYIKASMADTLAEIEREQAVQARAFERELDDLVAAAELERQAELLEQLREEMEGVAQQLVQDSGRDQTVAAVEGDEKALGFVRVASPDACAWCLTLAIRKTRAKEGKPERYGVYKSRATAGQIPPNDKGDTNRYHPNCNCQVMPVFANDYALSSALADIEQLYSDATENSKPRESLNDFRRALAAKRRGEEPERQEPAIAGPESSQADQLAALLARLP